MWAINGETSQAPGLRVESRREHRWRRTYARGQFILSRRARERREREGGASSPVSIQPSTRDGAEENRRRQQGSVRLALKIAVRIWTSSRLRKKRPRPTFKPARRQDA